MDIVYIATPDSLHAAHALLAIGAGKHVLVEKPFCLTPNDSDRVLSAARAAGVVCMEGMWPRFVPAISHALDLIRQGVLGSIRVVTSEFGCAYPIPAGALNALGCYSLAIGQLVAQAADEFETKAERASAGASVARPLSVQASGVLRPDGSDASFAAVLRYPRGLLSVCSATLESNCANEALISGSRGRLRLSGPLWHSTDRLELTFDGPHSTQTITFPDPEWKHAR